MAEIQDSGNTSNRRRFLRQTSLAALAAATWPLSLRAGEAGKKAPWAEEPKGPYAPFRMALQSYSLRKFEFQKAVETLYDVRLDFIDLWPGHFPANLDESEFRRRLRFMRQNMARRIAYGVVEFTKDHEANRTIFEFAKKLNVYAITANPAPDSFESIDKLAAQFELTVAIHNHGPDDKMYGTPDLIQKAIKDCSTRIGLCVDTGHFLRAGVKPAEVLKTFKDRVHAVHLKDGKSEGGSWKETIAGQGDLDLLGFLRALKASGFKGGLALEYEEEPENPVPSILKCLESVKEAVKKLPA